METYSKPTITNEDSLNENQNAELPKINIAKIAEIKAIVVTALTLGKSSIDSTHTDTLTERKKSDNH